jgi:hypothetical protein
LMSRTKIKIILIIKVNNSRISPVDFYTRP